MKTIARSANKDIFIYSGQLAMADGKIAQGQILEAAILTVKGELQFDLENGIPYFDTIFLSPAKAYLWRASVINRVKKFDWVHEVTQFDHVLDYKNHVVTYTMVVLTDLGTVTIRSIDYNISTVGSHTGEGGGGMESLIQNGVFYLPVYKENGVQIYRQLKQFIDPNMGGVTTELSEETYIKSAGVFVKQTLS
jgi:hypothetical protein